MLSYQLAKHFLAFLDTRETPKSYERVLKMPPRDLSDLIGRLTRQVLSPSRPESELVERILLWLVYTTGQLTTEQLDDALVNEEGRSDYRLPSAQSIVELCGSLVSLDDGDKIYLSHWTIAQHLKDHLPVPPPDAHARVAHTCLRYLQRIDLDDALDPESIEFEEMTKKHPLLPYAVVNWGRHAREAGSHLDVDVVIALLTSKTQWPVHQLLWRKACSNNSTADQYPPESCSALWVATYFGIEPVVHRLLADSLEDIDQKDASYGFTPVEEALYQDYGGLVETLLDAGATATARSLRLAVSGGFVELVYRLIDGGVDPNDMDGEKYSVLEQAVITGQHEVAEELLRRGISLPARTLREASIWTRLGNDWDTKMWNVLRKYLPERVANTGIYVAAMTAASGANLKGLQEMAENGLEIKPGKSHSGLISRAIEAVQDEGDSSVLDYLLSKGVRVTASNLYSVIEGAAEGNKIGKMLESILSSGSYATRDKGNDSDGEDDYDNILDPVDRAIRTGNAWALGLLINKTGRKVEDDEKTREHLRQAAGDGHTDLVRLLLQHGVAPYEEEDPDYDNALVEAIKNGHPDVVSVLLPHYQEENETAREARKAALEAATAEAGSVEDMKAILEAEKDSDQRATLASSALVAAVKAGSSEKLRCLISYGADVDALNDHGVTALAAATKKNNLDLMEVLLLCLADPNKRLYHGRTSLHTAAKEGFMDAAKLLLARKAKLNMIDLYGVTPLAEAAAGGHRDMVQLLLARGAAVAIRDQWGDTAATKAARRGDAETARLLNESSAPYQQGGTELHRIAIHVKAARAITLLATYDCLDAKNWYGETALYRAAEKGRNSIVEYLLFKGAKANLGTWSQQTPLMRAAEMGRADVVRLLLQWDAAGVNSHDRYGMTALHRASLHGHRSIAQDLLAAGADNSLKTLAGHTAAYLAAKAGHLNALRVLLGESLAGSSAQGEGGEDASCLKIATQEGHTSIVEFLLSRREASPAAADPDRTVSSTKDQEKLLEDAASNGQVAIMEALLKNGADPNKIPADSSGWKDSHLLTTTARNYRSHSPELVCDMLRLLLRFGANVNAEDHNGHTALKSAVGEGNAAAVAVLLDAGASLGKTSRRILNKSLLVTAAEKGNAAIVRQLLNAGAAVNGAEDEEDDGDKALGAAATAGHADVVQVLLEAGADVNARHGWAEATVLEETATKKQFEIVRLLLRAGANVDVVAGWANVDEISEALSGSNMGATRRLIQQARADRERIEETLRQRLWDMDEPELHAVLKECGVKGDPDADEE
jgi:ankyrin repeat protein